MRIAFYAPMKPPDDPVPSGDRQVAQNLMEAFALAGHEVEIASRLRSRDPLGERDRQVRLLDTARVEAETILARYRARPAAERPQAWFTYHLYYKAPDWIGPKVAAGLGIPYLVAEASVAHKRADGPWALNHQGVLAALEQAAAVVTLNPLDAECLPDPDRVRPLRPFLDPAPFQAAQAGKADLRAGLSRRHGLDLAAPWLLAVAMMRPGDKLASYRLLAAALEKLDDRPWHLLIVGDGRARAEVAGAFTWAAENRVRFLGEVAPDPLPYIYALSDLLVWPAVNEAWGMALLEAQASGLPVVAGHTPGVAAVVADGETGLVTEAGSADAFAAALGSLLEDSGRREQMAAAARRRIAAEHSLAAAAQRLDEILREAVAAGAAVP